MGRATIFFALLFGFVLQAQESTLFQEATEAYNQGDFQKAIDNYQAILDNGQHSAALYFNMGNAYYKQNKIAPSIYYYEKALLLNPKDREIQQNLAFAQNMTLDAVEPLPETFMARLYNRVVGIFGFDGWAYASIAFMLVFVLSYLSFYFMAGSNGKRFVFFISMVTLVLAFTSVFLAYLQYQSYKKDRPAIIFPKEVVVKSEPNLRSTEVFKLHTGTKVQVLETLGDWDKVQLANGTSGWLLSTDIKEIKEQP